MNLAASSYYYKPKSEAGQQAHSNAELRGHIERIRARSSGELLDL